MGYELDSSDVVVTDVSVAQTADEHVVDGTKEELLQSFVGGFILLVESGCVG